MVRFLALPLLAILPLLTVAQTNTTEVSWTGTWQTHWRGGGAVVHLNQQGNTVTGTYPLYEGIIEATTTHQNLVGLWQEASGRQGNFLLTMAPDGKTFMGRFESGEWWTGSRVSNETNFAVTPAILTSPRETLRSFLHAANAARAGSIERIQPGLDAIDFTSLESERLDGSTPLPQERIDYARKLFDVLDLCTFRVWGLPDPSEPGFTDAPSLTVTLRQSGSRETFDLKFIKEEDQWLISPPSTLELDHALERLHKRTGGQRQTANQHLELKNPRDTMRTFIEEMARFDTGGRTNIMRALDFESFTVEVQDEEAELLAYYLKHVIDHIGFVLYQEIPDNPSQHEAYIHFRHAVGNVTIAPFKISEDQTEWRFTAETLHHVRSLYSAIENMPEESGYLTFRTDSQYFTVREFLRSYLPSLLRQLGPMELWQWISLAGFLLISFVQAIILVSIILWILRRRQAWAEAFSTTRAQRAVTWPLRLSTLGLFWFFNIGALGLPEAVAGSSRRLAGTLAIASGVWLVYRGVGVAAQFSTQTLGTTGHKAVLASLSFGILRIIVLICGTLLLAEVWSVPYFSVLAGLGIGGLAFALAAQPTLQNMIAGFTLYADSPLSVGDLCRYGDKVGTVEQIGLRSTRIRSLERSIVSIPNSEFANLQLENLAKRDRRLLRTSLQLRYETTPDQLRYVLVELRRLLIAHPRVHPDPARVRFIEFNSHSLDLEIFAYIIASDQNQYLEVREDVFLRILQIVTEAGTGFAFPTMVNYMARDPGMNPDLTRQAEKTVAHWRENSNLPFPNLTQDEIRQLDGKLDFPPKGSPEAKTER